MKTIQVVHDETTITYNEPENKWEFTLRGRDRSADSLAKAREYIDKPLPAEKAKPFEKIQAWYFYHDAGPQKIEVTGVAEPSYYGAQPQVWIANNGKRSKSNLRYRIYPRNTKNDALVATIIEKRSAITKLRNEVEELQRKLDPLVIEKEEVIE